MQKRHACRNVAQSPYDHTTGSLQASSLIVTSVRTTLFSWRDWLEGIPQGEGIFQNEVEDRQLIGGHVLCIYTIFGDGFWRWSRGR
jgi:hypothetical protein